MWNILTMYILCFYIEYGDVTTPKLVNTEVNDLRCSGNTPPLLRLVPPSVRWLVLSLYFTLIGGVQEWILSTGQSYSRRFENIGNPCKGAGFSGNWLRFPKNNTAMVRIELCYWARFTLHVLVMWRCILRVAMETIRARRFLPFGSSSSAETVKLRTRKSKLYRKENNAVSRMHSESPVFRTLGFSHRLYV